MVSILARAVAVLVVASCCGANAQAQRLVVDIRDATLKSGVAGAVITVVEQRTGARVFGLANESGRASLKLPAAGAWAVSVRRIGIVPSGAAAVHVDTAQTVSVSIAVTSTRFTLPSVRVTAVAGSCGRAPRGDDRTSALWEQVTLALRASTLTRAETVAAPALRVQMFERVLDRSRKRLKEQPLRSGTGAGRPFFAADPDSLARFGYVRRERDGSFHYFAPDEVVLLSESFVKTHCFDSPASDADPRLAELRFRPVPDRTLPDVAGTAFVDTTTGELRRIEFRFVNVDQLFNSGRPEAGGDVALRQLRNGQWIVSDWTLRMPTFLRVPWRAESTVAGYRAASGDTRAPSTLRK